MKRILLEAKFDDFDDSELERHIYKDSETGKCYYFDGTQLVPVPEAKFDDGRLSDEEEQRIRDLTAQELGSEAETAEERRQRLDQIQKDLHGENSSSTRDAVKKETEYKVIDSKRRAQQRKAKAKSIAASGTIRGAEQFAKCITDFLGDQIKSRLRQAKWSAYNGKFHNTDILMKGRKVFDVFKNSDDCPLINVYFDQSGSFGQREIDMGNSMLRCLDQFESKGLLEVRKYYFDTKVQETPIGLGGGTSATCVIDHIRETKPDNVILITDNYVSDGKQAGKVVVPGGVWFLWINTDYTGENDGFRPCLSGAKMTRNFMLDFV